MGELILIACAGLVLGGCTGVFCQQRITKKELQGATKISEKILNDAQKEAQAYRKELILQGKDELLQQQKEFERETKAQEKELRKQESRLQDKEERLEKRQEQLTQKEQETTALEKRLNKHEKQLEEDQEKVEEILQQQMKKLEEISGMSIENAKELLLRDIESRTRHEAAKMIRQIEEEARETANRQAQEILATAVQRYAGDYASENTVSTVELPSDDMKGRIIGREGRNIRAIEAATGVDLIIDDTPETVVLSSFSPLRREIAKRSLERLISDGRIHPARIEDIVQKVQQEMNVKLREIGEQATFDVGIHGIHPELVRLLGQLYYRTSFSQNVLHHSLEVSFLCGIMAAELGLDVKKAKRAGLLHDLGKAVDHEVEGPHALIGADLAKRYNESKEIVHAIAAHHEDVPPKSAIAVLVQAADSLSGARPGARKELLESYVKRLEDLERIATNFQGVEQAYAIQAGREIRVMVDSKKVDDDSIFMLSKDISKEIEDNMSYPGQIRVTVIREKRAVGIAK